MAVYSNETSRYSLYVSMINGKSSLIGKVFLKDDVLLKIAFRFITDLDKEDFSYLI